MWCGMSGTRDGRPGQGKEPAVSRFPSRHERSGIPLPCGVESLTPISSYLACQGQDDMGGEGLWTGEIEVK